MKKLATTILVLLAFTANADASEQSDKDGAKDNKTSPMSLCEVLRVCDPDLKG